jgi:hypothetical protein
MRVVKWPIHSGVLGAQLLISLWSLVEDWICESLFHLYPSCRPKLMVVIGRLA